MVSSIIFYSKNYQNYQVNFFIVLYNICCIYIYWSILIKSFLIVISCTRLIFFAFITRRKIWCKYLCILKLRARCSSDDDRMQLLCEANRMRQETNCSRSTSSSAAIEYSHCYCRPNDLIVAIQKICLLFAMLFY